MITFSEETFRQRPLILLIEDHHATAFTLTQILRRSGARCVTACSAEWALEWFRRSMRVELDAVLTDIHLPGRDGRWAVRELRALNPGLRAAMMTGDDRQPAKYWARTNEVEYFLKPISIESLRTWLSEIRSKALTCSGPGN